MLRKALSLGCIVILTACAQEWAPVVDRDSDANIAQLNRDMTQCQAIAEQVGIEEATSRTKTKVMLEDGEIVSRKAYHHAWVNCLKTRGHPLITGWD